MSIPYSITPLTPFFSAHVSLFLSFFLPLFFILTSFSFSYSFLLLSLVRILYPAATFSLISPHKFSLLTLQLSFSSASISYSTSFRCIFPSLNIFSYFSLEHFTPFSYFFSSLYTLLLSSITISLSSRPCHHITLSSLSFLPFHFFFFIHISSFSPPMRLPILKFLTLFHSLHITLYSPPSDFCPSKSSFSHSPPTPLSSPFRTLPPLLILVYPPPSPGVIQAVSSQLTARQEVGYLWWPPSVKILQGHQEPPCLTPPRRKPPLPEPLFSFPLIWLRSPSPFSLSFNFIRFRDVFICIISAFSIYFVSFFFAFAFHFTS